MDTRGVRNKNPFNIKLSDNPWIGKKTPSSDPEFEQFHSLVYGIRAGLVLLRNYIREFHCNTPRKIISRFAPPSENSTPDYLFFVSTYVPLDKELKFGDETFCLLVQAILLYESDYFAKISYLTTLISKFKLL